ncbi:MAG: hypothetical protein EP343_16965 [Deltaproteobacteria bacterium]|nr:MAG: hypothetical protein EP343_16965 [Deltaproteobacteria bacterium]
MIVLRSVFTLMCMLFLLVCFQVQAAKPKPKTVCKWEKAKTVKSGVRDFQGWLQYIPAIECKTKQLQKASPDPSSPEGVMVKFFQALMKQDKAFTSTFSPSMPAPFRVILEKGLLAQTTNFKRFIIHARISSSKAPKGNRFSKRFGKQGSMMFGAFDLLVFAEGNTSRTDIIVFLKQTKKRWYIQGLLCSWLEPMFKGMKKPWWVKAKKGKKTDSKSKK